ncbi:MAG: hypothetical protein D8M57_15350 [Candidatus Scalindua sp. AMX11]|nr:MAG: hypothetical protein DWQ00_02300 [Candidatus Scalindua sp.]NOG84025.1 hypothetical protein [Planctomycetota bacterium]RZV88093.1 MAG: hypothetical protein EX341_07235 [Candidatus Scalindua sp. SCAELEC01]TDE64026.1 MAG: hypothetical protein D8M57_15350 [Candidatus Scalindua sp. AMX11]GJQ60496.1 MAG: hypothetical protein SCALA701_32970 [Candidatus Scalindua sp.]
MDKKKALGGDPLSWLKEKKREEKEEAHTLDQEPQTKKSIPPQNKEEQVVQPAYEPQKEHTYKPQETHQKRRRIVIDDHEPVYNTNIRTPKPKENPATIFVVVYTVLLLILGFLVFRDMTKKINNLEEKIIHLEKQLESGYTRYEDSDF